MGEAFNAGGGRYGYLPRAPARPGPVCLAAASLVLADLVADDATDGCATHGPQAVSYTHLTLPTSDLV